jgi:transposase
MRSGSASERQREVNRLHKLLEDAGIKLSLVASDTLGASGRAMIEALIRGERDPAVLAELAEGRLRQKLPSAAPGAARPLYRPPRPARRAHLSHLGYLDETIGALSSKIAKRLRLFQAKAELLETINGVGHRSWQSSAPT